MTITAVRRTLQVRIHERGTVTPTDGTVEITLGHSRLLAVPSFGGQTVHPTEGRTESRPYWLEVLDVANDFTGQIAVNGRMAMLGRLVEIRMATDGGAYATVDVRRLSSLESGSEPVYRLELSDERWIERRTTLFERSFSYQFFPPGRAVPWMGFAAAGTAFQALGLRFRASGIITANVVLFTLTVPSGLSGPVGQVGWRVTEAELAQLTEDQLEQPALTSGAFFSLRFAPAAGGEHVILGFDGVPSATTGLIIGGPLPKEAPLTDASVASWERVSVYWPAHGLLAGDVLDGRMTWSKGVRTTAVTPYEIGGTATEGIRAPGLWEEIAAGEHGGAGRRKRTRPPWVPDGIADWCVRHKWWGAAAGRCPECVERPPKTPYAPCVDMAMAYDDAIEGRTGARPPVSPGTVRREVFS